tara:strand:+ start:132 stop:644 length:513 start_codon:yes stop_codon:yes gene_type:complete
MSFILWFTGLPCSGKSTIARLLKKNLPNLEVLDGDALVKQLKFDDWSRDSRNKHSERVANIAKSFLEDGTSVCVAKISPFREMSMSAKQILKDFQFFEVYVECSVEECEKRDVKGMYKMAKNGELNNFCGVNETYEIPKQPDLILNTEKFSMEDNLRTLLNFLKSNNLQT